MGERAVNWLVISQVVAWPVPFVTTPSLLAGVALRRTTDFSCARCLPVHDGALEDMNRQPVDLSLFLLLLPKEEAKHASHESIGRRPFSSTWHV